MNKDHSSMDSVNSRFLLSIKVATVCSSIVVQRTVELYVCDQRKRTL